jgi:hypothetical protein
MSRSSGIDARSTEDAVSDARNSDRCRSRCSSSGSSWYWHSSTSCASCCGSRHPRHRTGRTLRMASGSPSSCWARWCASAWLSGGPRACGQQRRTTTLEPARQSRRLSPRGSVPRLRSPMRGSASGLPGMRAPLPDRASRQALGEPRSRSSARGYAAGRVACRAVVEGVASGDGAPRTGISYAWDGLRAPAIKAGTT